MSGIYKRRDSLSILFDLKIRTIDKILKEIESCDRYPKNSVIRDTGYTLADVDVFVDYLANRKILKKEGGNKRIPPYKANNIRYLNAVE